MNVKEDGKTLRMILTQKKTSIECMSIVKFILSPSNKGYKRGKHVYEYIRPSMSVPQKLYNRLEPYSKEEFHVNVTDNDSKETITFAYRKSSKSKELLWSASLSVL